MKKILVILLTIILFTGCSLLNKQNGISTSFGRYEIPKTWQMNRGHSTKNKYFFTHKGDKHNPPNNISVEYGTNGYKKDNHIIFKNAIMRQLLMQTKGSGAIINGSAWSSVNGDIIYSFTIKEKKSTTVQHYIVGNYSYVLVHETIWYGEEEDVHNAAKTIINTFKWK